MSHALVDALPDGLRYRATGSHSDAGHHAPWRHLVAAAGSGDDVLPWPLLLAWLEREPCPTDRDPDGWEDASETALRLARTLPLPRVVAPSVSLRADGGLESATFRVEATWMFPFGETMDPDRRIGAWYPSHRRGAVLLPKRHLALLNQLAEPVPATRGDRMLWWARVKRAAEGAQADMDGYLANEDAVLVERIRPVFTTRDDGGVDVAPSGLEVPASDYSAARWDREMTVRRGGERRTRVVHTPEALTGLRQIAEKPSFTREEAAKLAASPEAYFDPAIFDLSQYSDRVVGFGPPRYRANVVVKPSSPNMWFGDGEAPSEVILELHDERDPEAPPLRINLNDDAARERANAAVHAAWEREEPYADIDEHLVRITPELRAALSDLPTGHGPAEPPEPRPEELKGMVLQIEENVEELGFGERSDLRHPPPAFTPPWPAGMSAQFEPKPHQVSGYRTLAWWGSGDSSPIRGGLVADDMGLGKTFQVLALLSRLAEEGRMRPTLVVAPASLLTNWENEARRFAPSVFQRIRSVKEVPRGHERSLGSCDLVLTSYETLASRDIELGRIPWKVVVCDEAQKIKNASTRMSQAVKAMHGELRIAVTGTPVENSLDDLWSITDFFQPGLLGALREFRAEHNAAVIQDPSQREQAAAGLRAKLSPVMLRRLKGEAGLSLPAIRKEHIACKMSALQTQLYMRVREVRTGGQGQALAAIGRMLQTCAHPGLLMPQILRTLDPIEACPKLSETVRILDQVRQRGEKALIFARWIDLQHLLADTLGRRYQTSVSVLNGTVPAERRQGIVDAFSRRPGFGILVLAARACGVGLNITAANHVIHYTREWNPAVEAQATDRVYRIGQTRPVTVYLPVVEADGFDTAEVILSRVLDTKDALRSDFIQPVEHCKVGLQDFERAGAFTRSQTPLRPDDLQLIDPMLLALALAGKKTKVSVHQQVLDDPSAPVFALSDGSVRMILTEDRVPSRWPPGLPEGRREVVATHPVGFLTRLTSRGLGELLDPTQVCTRLAAAGFTLSDLLGGKDARDDEP